MVKASSIARFRNRASHRFLKNFWSNTKPSCADKAKAQSSRWCLSWLFWSDKTSCFEPPDHHWNSYKKNFLPLILAPIFRATKRHVNWIKTPARRVAIETVLRKTRWQAEPKLRSYVVYTRNWNPRVSELSRIKWIAIFESSFTQRHKIMICLHWLRCMRSWEKKGSPRLITRLMEFLRIFSFCVLKQH